MKTLEGWGDPVQRQGQGGRGTIPRDGKIPSSSRVGWEKELLRDGKIPSSGRDKWEEKLVRDGEIQSSVKNGVGQEIIKGGEDPVQR